MAQRKNVGAAAGRRRATILRQLAEIAAEASHLFAELAELEDDTGKAPAPKRAQRRGPRLPKRIRQLDPERTAKVRRDLEEAGLLRAPSSPTHPPADPLEGVTPIGRAPKLR